jgi:hypothetical protein
MQSLLMTWKNISRKEVTKIGPAKVYRINKDYILKVDSLDAQDLTKAYVMGFSFIQCGECYYLLNTNKKRNKLTVQMVDIEFVD